MLWFRLRLLIPFDVGLVGKPGKVAIEHLQIGFRKPQQIPIVPVMQLIERVPRLARPMPRERQQLINIRGEHVGDGVDRGRGGDTLPAYPSRDNGRADTEPACEVRFVPLSPDKLALQPCPYSCRLVRLSSHVTRILACCVRWCYIGSMTHDIAGRRYIATPDLKATIRRQGRLLSWFAQQIGVTQGHFSHVLSGRRSVSEDHARFIATVLGSDFFSLWNVSDGKDTVPEDTEAVA